MSWVEISAIGLMELDLGAVKPLGQGLGVWIAFIALLITVLGIIWKFGKTIVGWIKHLFKKTPNQAQKIVEVISGRDKELAKLDKHFASFSGQRAAVIIGQGGIGKTVLAQAYGAARVTTGQYHKWIMLPLNSETEMATALGGFAAELDVAENPNAEIMIAQMMDAMQASGKHWLVILDNADESEEADLARNSLRNADNIDFIITSQLTQWPAEYKHIKLGPLAEDDAVKLLASNSGRPIDDELRKLAVETLECLPLAITIVGTDLKTQSIELKGYAKDFNKLLGTAPDNTTKYKKSVFTAVTMAVKRLEKPEQALLNLAAYMDANDIDTGHILRGVEGVAIKQQQFDGYDNLPEPLYSLCQDQNTLLRALAKCAKHSLLTASDWHGQNTYRIHRTTQMVLREAMSEAENTETIGLAARLGAAQMYGHPQYEIEYWPLYHRLAPQALALLPFAAQATKEDAERAGYFFNTIALFLEHATDDKKLVLRIKKVILPVVEQAYGRESGDYASALTNLAVTQDDIYFTSKGAKSKVIDKEAEKNLKSAISIFGSLKGIDLSLAYAHNNLAALYHARARFPEAEVHNNISLDLRQKHGAVDHVLGQSYGNLGVLYSHWAKVEVETAKANDLREKATLNKMKALDLTRKGLGEVHFETAIRYHNLTEEHRVLGNVEISLEHRVRAVAIIHIMRDEKKIPEDHPRLVNYTRNLSLDLREAGRDPSEAAALIEAEKPKIFADHRKWELAQSGGDEPDT